MFLLVFSKRTSQVYIDLLWDKTQVVSSAPLLPHTMGSKGNKLGVQVLWELQCVTFRALIGMAGITTDRAASPQSRYSLSSWAQTQCTKVL